MVHDGHRGRLKQRFMQEGLEGFEPHNVLELLLFYPIPYKDTNETAHALLERFGSLSEVLEAPVSELVKVKGVGEHTAIFLSMLPQVFRKYHSDKVSGMKIHGIDEISDFAAKCFTGMHNEHFMLICMDNTDTMLNHHMICEGSVNTSNVDMRKIIELLIGSNATRAIIAHNHPRGSFEPSRADLLLTMTIANSLKTIDVKLMDHLVVASDGRYLAMSKNPKKYSYYLNPI